MPSTILRARRASGGPSGRPLGVGLTLVQNSADVLRNRLSLLIENGAMGLVLVAPGISGIAARPRQAALATIGETLTDEEFPETLRVSGEPVADAKDADGYRVADGDAAIDDFPTNAEDCGDPLMV